MIKHAQKKVPYAGFAVVMGKYQFFGSDLCVTPGSSSLLVIHGTP